jgi:drug/metabolite transporter (DMT)-like permease
MKSTNALFASMNTYLMPLMAIFWGWLDGEPIGWPHFISLFVILIGVYLVSKRK